jgi:hypothetical protein
MVIQSTSEEKAHFEKQKEEEKSLFYLPINLTE